LNFRISRAARVNKSKQNLWSNAALALEWLLLALDTPVVPPSVFFFEIVAQGRVNFAADTRLMTFKPQ
jgi:hypothetical protein